MPTFLQALTTRIFDSLYDNHQDNYDAERFGPLPKRTTAEHIRDFGKSLFRRLGFYRIEDVFNPVNKRNWMEWSPHFTELDWLYSVLNDDDSKSLLVDVVAYHIMGTRHIKLPLPMPDYWLKRSCAKKQSLEVQNQSYMVGGFDLVVQSFEQSGIPVRIYQPSGGHFMTFILEQYACPRLDIRVRQGDIVIDAGACWGDTAIYFAQKVGTEGRVYSFEFVPENLGIFQLNLNLNPTLARIIEVVPHPVWSSSGVGMGQSNQGPSAKVEPGAATAEGQPVSLSIDDLVVAKQIPHVDFIKMDIEGAEFEALKGATQTIITHKPDLALCVYHSKDDFTRLARYINSLDLGYRFALGHFTIHGEETVIFATCQDPPLR